MWQALITTGNIKSKKKYKKYEAQAAFAAIRHISTTSLRSNKAQFWEETQVDLVAAY